jgi:hypothetical protein
MVQSSYITVQAYIPKTAKTVDRLNDFIELSQQYLEVQQQLNEALPCNYIESRQYQEFTSAKQQAKNSRVTKKLEIMNLDEMIDSEMKLMK